VTNDFSELIQAAEAAHFSGWDFSWLDGRLIEDAPPWDYRQIVLRHLSDAASLLDMGTGGGEFLASLPGLPADTQATEAYPPNIKIAKARLEPLGIRVHALNDGEKLPLPDESFDLVINRHESFDPMEVFRILKPGALFITQQVGGRDNIALNQFLAPGINLQYADWDLLEAVKGLKATQLNIKFQQEVFPENYFLDVGAVVYYLKVIEWQIPGFDIQQSRDKLKQLHQHILENGYFQTLTHRFLIIAEKI
jgi:SAM-dependent methyltransferase